MYRVTLILSILKNALQQALKTLQPDIDEQVEVEWTETQKIREKRGRELMKK